MRLCSQAGLTAVERMATWSEPAVHRLRVSDTGIVRQVHAKQCHHPLSSKHTVLLRPGSSSRLKSLAPRIADGAMAVA